MGYSIPLVTSQKPHAVCIPYPAQGHVNPVSKLAKLLHHNGFHITFVNTEFNHNRLLKSRGVHELNALPPSFQFKTIPDGLPPPSDDAKANVTQDIPTLCESTTTHCLAPFKDLLSKLNDPPVSCIISDGFMSFTLLAAEELGIPHVFFWTTSACGFYAYMQYHKLLEKDIVPLKDVNVLRKLMNPWAFGLQKLGLELKCPLCLDLLDKPVLLPCNHLFCSNCVPAETRCVVCQTQYDSGGMRPAPYMDNIVAIYKMLDTTLSSTINQSLSWQQSPVSAHRSAPRNAEITTGKGGTAEPRASLSSSDAYIAGLSDKADKGAVSKLNEVAACVGSETAETYMNQAPELSPDSSPSCAGQTRSITANNANQGSRDMLVKSTAKRSAECLLDEGKDGITPRSTKRQQIASNCFTAEKKVICAANGFVSQSPLEPAKEEHLPILPLAKPSNSSNLAGSVCSFCHSSKITEGSGTMLYFANGKEVKEDLTMPSNAIAVHSKCVEWTPQVYFEDDNIMNLESELKRASKLKCSKCGLKGAGLGCYLKSCSKSYHVPCAFDTEGCRWNYERFLVLCPQHTRIKFEGEKSKSRSKKVPTGLKHPLKTDSPPVNPTESTESTESAFWKSSPHGRQEWVFCGSALSSDEKYSLAKFADMCGATCSNLWIPTVTHIIAATDEKGACARTYKYLMGILNGRWILNMGWINACLEAKKYVNEEPYEIVSDIHGNHDGPKIGRLRHLNNEPKVFDGLKFYFSGDFDPKYLLDLLKLVRTAGGVVIESLDELKQSPDITGMVVVYNYESSPCPDEDNKSVMKWLAEAQSIGKSINSPVVRYTWILECISAGKRFPYAS